MRRLLIAAIVFVSAGFASASPAPAADPEITPFARGGIRAEDTMSRVQREAVPFGTVRFAAAFQFRPMAELAVLEAEIWEMSERGTREGIFCNIDAASCLHGDRGATKLVPASAADKRRLNEILRTIIVPDWIVRCGETCPNARNDALGSALRVPIP